MVFGSVDAFSRIIVAPSTVNFPVTVRGGALFNGESVFVPEINPMFPLAIILAVASFRCDPGIWRYALPIAASGWLIAAFHTLLSIGVIPKTIEPCGQGPACSSADMTILGGLPLPFLSLAAFTGIAVLLVLAHRRSSL